MEHVFNCHGEWLILFQALVTLPVVGVWLRSVFLRPHPHEGHDLGDGEPHDINIIDAEK